MRSDGAMLDQVDELIRAVLLRDVKSLSRADQVRFQPSDDDWRTAVTNLAHNALNVYLVDLRENRALRDNEWLVRMDADGPHRDVGPARIDCHYLISAWNPAAVTPATEPTLDEHALLYEAMAALLNADPLNPSHVYPPGSAALNAVDELIRDADLPVQVAPAEGWPKIAEFWGAMGVNDRWKPTIWYTVTVPVAFARQVAGPLAFRGVCNYAWPRSPSLVRGLAAVVAISPRPTPAELAHEWRPSVRCRGNSTLEPTGPLVRLACRNHAPAALTA